MLSAPPRSTAQQGDGFAADLPTPPYPMDFNKRKWAATERNQPPTSHQKQKQRLIKCFALPSTGKEIFGRTAEETDDRFANMLSEASQMIKSQHNQQTRAMAAAANDDSSNDNLSKSPSSSSPFSKDQAAMRRKKYENDDIPQEKVARIYQEEFSKLISTRDVLPK